MKSITFFSPRAEKQNLAKRIRGEEKQFKSAHKCLFPSTAVFYTQTKRGKRIKELAGRRGDFASLLPPRKGVPPPQSFLKGIFLQVPHRSPSFLLSLHFAAAAADPPHAARSRRTPLFGGGRARASWRESPRGISGVERRFPFSPPSSFCARKIGGRERAAARERESFPSTKRNPPPASAKVSGAGERRIGGRRGRTNSCVRGKKKEEKGGEILHLRK